jgi:predicted secreted Zn-dependent protease
MRLFTRKKQASRSGDERAKTWRKSSRSLADGNCVEVAAQPGDRVMVRDSKDPQGAVLWFAPTEWDTFVAGVRSGELGR